MVCTSSLDVVFLLVLVLATVSSADNHGMI
jgi:hypothetical protein